MQENKIDLVIEDAIEKCQTAAHRAKEIAGDLRNNGFDGQLCGELLKQAQILDKYGHMYQAYINTLAWEER